MTCPTCKSKHQRQDFCGKCGAQLKKKCAVCGNMEPLWLGCCFTQLEQAQDERRIYLMKEVGTWRISLGFVLFFFIPLPLAIITSIFFLNQFSNLFPASNDFDALFILMSFLIPSIAAATISVSCIFRPAYKRQNQAEEVALERFKQHFPQHAEILENEIKIEKALNMQ